MPGRHSLEFSGDSNKTYKTLIDGGYVLPGNVKGSLLAMAIKDKHSLINLPSEKEEKLIKEWIDAGAHD